MPHLGPALSRRLTRRTCLVCGHQGRRLQGPSGLTATRCPNCNADLYARPPRSYAEMEGLVDVSPAGGSPRRDPRPITSAPLEIAPRTTTGTLRRHAIAAAVVIVAAGLGAALALLVF